MEKVNNLLNMILKQNGIVVESLKSNEAVGDYIRGYIAGIEYVLKDVNKVLEILNKDGGENDGCNL